MDVSEVRTRQVAGELFAHVDDLADFCNYAKPSGIYKLIHTKTGVEERAAHKSSASNYVSLELIGLALERVERWHPSCYSLKRYHEAVADKTPKQLNLELDDTEQVPFALSFEDLLKGYDQGIITGEQLAMLMAIKED